MPVRIRHFDHVKLYTHNVLNMGGKTLLRVTSISNMSQAPTNSDGKYRQDVARLEGDSWCRSVGAFDGFTSSVGVFDGEVAG